MTTLQLDYHSERALPLCTFWFYSFTFVSSDLSLHLPDNAFLVYRKEQHVPLTHLTEGVSHILKRNWVKLHEVRPRSQSWRRAGGTGH